MSLAAHALTTYAEVRPRLVATAVRHPRLARGLVRGRNAVLRSLGRPEHAARFASAVRAATIAAETDVLGPRVWPRSHLRWVLLDGLPGSASSRYRVAALRQTLEEAGHDVAVLTPEDLEEEAATLVSADVALLFRTGSGDVLHRLLGAARDAGAAVVYDIDDLVFDPEVANERYVDGLRYLTAAERPLYREGVLSYRRALDEAELVTVPTAPLARAAEALGKRAIVVPNSLTEPWLRARRTESDHGDHVVIGYASGTRTHQRDFASAAGGVARALASVPSARLHIIGDLDIDGFPELAPHANRIALLPKVAFDDLAETVATFDVNIAPLEVGNPYCEAKSELKYFEAGILGIPTVASPTEPFRLAIQHGVNGYLAGTFEEWERALVALCTDGAARRRVGEAARAASTAHFGREAHAAAVATVEADLRRWRQDSRTVITMLLPGVDAGGGGASKALDLFSGLGSRETALQVVVRERTGSFSSSRSLSQHYRLAERGITTIMSDSLVPSSDITITTFYSTALAAEAAGPARGHVVQLLQDYEPLFFPMSERYLMAQASLELPHSQITYGPWIANMLREHHGREGAHVLPYYIDQDLYYPAERAMPPRDKVRIAFFARPEMPRRCYPLAVEALEQVVKRVGDKVEVVMFGSHVTRQLAPTFPHRDAGVLVPAALAQLYRSCDLGVVVSPTNPSMVPFEMMACGLPVVDIDVPFNAENYGGRDNVILAEPRVDLLAATIERAVLDEKLRRGVAESGLRWAQSLPSADDVKRMFADAVTEAAATEAPPRS